MDGVSRAGILRGLRAAVQLARGDAAAVSQFDLSLDGFWISFYAALLAAPGYLLLVAEQYAQNGLPARPEVALATEALSFMLGIVTFPLLAIPLTRMLGLGGRYVPLIIATNWAGLLQIGVYVAAVLLGALLPPLRPSLLLTALLASLAYQWFVVRASLLTTGNVATAILLIDVLCGLLINRGLDWLMLPA